MLKEKLHNRYLLVIVILFFFCLFSLFFASPDSYLYDIYYRIDTAWFFTAGKAWMNGMLPYKDFADSKGPLLWLIYGFGYLLNNYSYIGVFWISVIWYTITLFIYYRISKLLGLNDGKSLLISIIMLVMFLVNNRHFEVRAEDWCQPFFALSIYALVRTTQINKILLSGALIGFSIGSVFLIKWNYGVLMGVFACCYLYEAYMKKLFLKAFLFGLLGFMVAILPFFVYFLSVGIFSDFINEYLISTTATIKNNISCKMYMLALVKYLNPSAIYIWLLFFTYCFSRYYLKKIWPIGISLFFILSLSYQQNYYYYQIADSFAIFPLVYFFQLKPMTDLFDLIAKKRIYIVIYLVFWVGIIAGSAIINAHSFYGHLYNNSEGRHEFYSAMYVMSQIKSPKIIYSHHDIGLGVSVNALPGTRYWALQWGVTPNMLVKRKNAISQGIPDFIVIYQNTYGKELQQVAVKKGYIPYTKIKNIGENYDAVLYGRPGLKLPPNDYMPSNLDILLKRRLF